MDEFSRIVEKQIAWNYREHFAKGGGDDGGRSASERAGGALPTACSAEEVSFVIGHFFAVSPRRPRREDFVVGVHAKNWILCSFHLYSVFSACGPLGCSYRVQNEWVKLLFKYWTMRHQKHQSIGVNAHVHKTVRLVYTISTSTQLLF